MPRLHLLVSLFAFSLCTLAMALPDPPGSATVTVMRADHILMPQGIFAPKLLYPEGRIDFGVVEKLVDGAIESVTGEKLSAGWLTLFKRTDRIGIMVDAGKQSVQSATVETIIDRLVNAGISQENIIVFGGDERDLFNAGFNINKSDRGVRVLGTASEGFRGGVSRIVSDYCDALINLATLKADPEIGFDGCVANALYCIPNEDRIARRRDPATVPVVAALPGVRQKTRLCLLEAYLPVLDTVGQSSIPWVYKGLIAGTDPVAVDTVGRRILQGCRNAYKKQPWPLEQPVDYLKTAQERYRLGQADPGQIKVVLQGPADETFLQ